jgi:predicted transcriptional regulator
MAKIMDAVKKNTPATTPARSKLDMIEQLLSAKGGTSIADLMTATSWQQHSIRGAMAGALKKRGLIITSEKVDGQRRYRGQRP